MRSFRASRCEVASFFYASLVFSFIALLATTADATAATTSATTKSTSTAHVRAFAELHDYLQEQAAGGGAVASEALDALSAIHGLDQGAVQEQLRDVKKRAEMATGFMDNLMSTPKWMICRVLATCWVCAKASLLGCAWCGGARACADYREEPCSAWTISSDMCPEGKLSTEPSPCSTFNSCESCLGARIQAEQTVGNTYDMCAWCQSHQRCGDMESYYCPDQRWLQMSQDECTVHNRCDGGSSSFLSCRDCVGHRMLDPTSWGACAWCESRRSCMNYETQQCEGNIWTHNEPFCLADGRSPGFTDIIAPSSP
eukprot:gnl/Spiro4/24336_TR12093_c0_g1_i1.p1 gnl/Spiro4/24336_TR12093_c0_g1~~gnl/Spiro4/24336_TR12093_c0_g1_i1.p1  ORF type:complete len:313 (-),score=37.70 gnl/Spiro4/24336_TR12093_c0_g1_i1:76-1014(-)